MGTRLVTGTDAINAKDLACLDQVGGGGTVTSVNAGTGISITGTAADPVVNNTGVLSVTAGTGISLTGTAADPVVNNAGVLSVFGGARITDVGTPSDPVLVADLQQGGFHQFFAFGFGASPFQGQLLSGSTPTYLRPYTAPGSYPASGDLDVIEYPVLMDLSDVRLSVNTIAYTDLGAGGNYTVAVMKNGAASALGLVISGTGVQDATGGPVTFVSGDKIGIKLQAAGSVGVSASATFTLEGVPG